MSAVFALSSISIDASVQDKKRDDVSSARELFRVIGAGFTNYLLQNGRVATKVAKISSEFSFLKIPACLLLHSEKDR